jgi:hypothetical protein
MSLVKWKFKKVSDIFVGSSIADKDNTWKNRKTHTIGMLKTIFEEATILVLADKLDNIRAIRQDYERHGEPIWRRFKRPRDQQQWYYETLAEAFTDSLTDERSRNLLDTFKAEVDRVFGYQIQSEAIMR